MIITKTPFRISLFGGGSDHPGWFHDHGGQVISFTIDKYCYLTTRILPPFFDHNYRIAYSKVEVTKTVDEIQHPVVRESIRRFSPNMPLEIHHDGDLPARSGVGSSSAFAVGIIHALQALKGIDVEPVTLANFAIELEQKVLKENVGFQDQIACALGGINFIEFGPREIWRYTPINPSSEFIKDIESRIALIFTGVSRSSSDISAGLLENLQAKDTYMRRLMWLADSCRQLFMREGDLDDIGAMLHESWELKKLTNSRSTNEHLDELYARARKAGAVGGKILGAGGGGFFLFWLPPNTANEFQERFSFGNLVPVKISFNGSQVVYLSTEGSRFDKK